MQLNAAGHAASQVLKERCEAIAQRVASLYFEARPLLAPRWEGDRQEFTEDNRRHLAHLGEALFCVHSSWMVVLMAVPIFTAYGIVYGGGWLFPLVAAGALLPFLVLPAVVGSMLTLVLVNVFPARRARDILSLVAIGAAGGLVLLFRVIRPERLARPEGVRNLLDYLATLQTPTNAFIPSEWATHMVMNWLTRVADPLPVVLLWTTRAGLRGAGRPAPPADVRRGLHQGPGGRRARLRGAVPGPDRGAPAGPALAEPAGVRAQGPADLLPRHPAVEPADPAGRPARSSTSSTSSRCRSSRARRRRSSW